MAEDGLAQFEMVAIWKTQKGMFLETQQFPHTKGSTGSKIHTGHRKCGFDRRILSIGEDFTHVEAY